MRTCAFASKFAAAWSTTPHGSSSLQARSSPPVVSFIVSCADSLSQIRLRAIILTQFMSSLCDLFCLVVCTPLLLMPWAWAAIPPLLQHYATRHTRPGGENACETWRAPMLLLLLTSAAEAALLCLCIVCLACPWHWRRIASMLLQVSTCSCHFLFCVHLLTCVEGRKSPREAIGFACRDR